MSRGQVAPVLGESDRFPDVSVPGPRQRLLIALPYFRKSFSHAIAAPGCGRATSAWALHLIRSAVALLVGHHLDGGSREISDRRSRTFRRCRGFEDWTCRQPLHRARRRVCFGRVFGRTGRDFGAAVGWNGRSGTAGHG